MASGFRLLEFEARRGRPLRQKTQFGAVLPEVVLYPIEKALT